MKTRNKSLHFGEDLSLGKSSLVRYSVIQDPLTSFDIDLKMLEDEIRPKFHKKFLRIIPKKA
jgi:hypothetical protein